jgi:hypothetical protein
MTRATNARIAGFAFLFYIAVGVSSLVLSGRATSGDAAPAKLASIARHSTDMGVVVVLTLLAGFSAVVLAATLYGLTSDEDPDLARLAFACRVGEGVLGVFPLSTLGLLWLGTAGRPDAPDPATVQALASLLKRVETWQSTTCAILFAVGSTLFSWLFLRGRLVPVAMAWLGVLASVLLVVLLPAQLAGFLGGVVTQAMWLPMLVFEVTLAVWLLVKGAAAPAARRTPGR